MYGCNVANDGSFLLGHNRFTYCGYDYTILNENLRSWNAQDKVAQTLRDSWEAEGITEIWRTYLLGECTERLLRCLDLGKETLLRSVRDTLTNPFCFLTL
jgi:major histocompatibility complex class I